MINQCSCNAIDNVWLFFHSSLKLKIKMIVVLMTNILWLNLCTNPCLFRINKIEHNLREFCYKGEANDKLCIFRIHMVQYFHNKSKIYRIGCIKNKNNCNVKYHTGKQIIKYKTITKVWLAKPWKFQCWLLK